MTHAAAKQPKKPRRAYGSGSVWTEPRSRGRSVYVGQVCVHGRQVQRVLGQVRQNGGKDGLTRAMAERALRDLRARLEDDHAKSEAQPGLDQRSTLSEVGEQQLDHLVEVIGRKRATVQDYGIYLRKHLIDFFGADRPLADISPQDVEAFMRHQRSEGLAASTISNHVNYLHAIYSYAVKRGLAPSNPVAFADKIRIPHTSPDIKFLTVEEVEALLRVIPDDDLGPTDRVLYLAATYTGLRQGELRALRWKDIDWQAGVIRVRRNFTRGEEGTPKSRRSSRAVPMDDRLATALAQHQQQTLFAGDDDRVFCHPHTGHPYDASKIRKRFYEAMKTAGMACRCGRANGITFHSFRHTFGTRMAAAGAPMRAIQEWMGHRDIQTTQIYADYSPDPTNGREWVRKAFKTDDADQPVAAGSSAGEHLGARIVA